MAEPSSAAASVEQVTPGRAAMLQHVMGVTRRCIFPQHLCVGSPFLLSLSASCLIAGSKLFGFSRAARAPLLLLLYPFIGTELANISESAIYQAEDLGDRE